MLYVVLVAVVLAAVPGTWWLKRAGDRSWRRHRERLLLAETRAAWVRFQLDVADRFTPAMREVARQVTAMGAAMERMRPVLEQVGRELAKSTDPTPTGDTP